MKRIIETNYKMDELLLIKPSKNLCSLKKRKIVAELNSFLNKVQLYQENHKKCFSVENCFSASIFKTSDHISITDWEWNNNEIYIDGGLIGKNFKQSMDLVLNTIETFLFVNFPNNSFCITVSVQLGKFKNMNIRVYLNRGELYANSDIEKYNQPVLNEIVFI